MSPLIVGFLVVGLFGPKPTHAFAPDAVPAGKGWSCFQHTNPGSLDLGHCSRTEAECVVEQRDDGVDRCAAQPKAWCSYVNADDLACFPRASACDAWQKQASASFPTAVCTELD